MQLESFGYNTNDLLFFWLYQDKFGKPEKAIDMGPGLELPQFRILGYRTADCTKKYTSGNYTCIKGIFTNKTKLLLLFILIFS